MTSVTSPQQTSRSGADIPGPRGGQVVRLLVLGTDADAQEFRDRAAAAGFELAQRYSARVSHVAYGSGVDPEDAKYHRIHEAGLALLPIQAFASQLGLAQEGAARDERRAEQQEEEAAGGATDADEAGGSADAREGIAEAELAKVVAVLDPGAEVEAEPGEDGAAEGEAQGEAESEIEGKVEVLEFRSLRREESPGESVAGLVPGFSPFDEKLGQSVADAYAPLETLEDLGEIMGTASDELPLGAAVIGVDPWTGPTPGPEKEEMGEAGEAEEETPDVLNVSEISDLSDVATEESAEETAGAQDDAADDGDTCAAAESALDCDLEAADAPVTEAAAASADFAAESAEASAGAPADAAPAPSRSSAGHVLLSLAWALIPFVTFGLLTPFVFGYGALRLRSRMLGAVAFGYAVAVVLSFALSASRPSGTSPSGASGAILTLALATAWIGGTVHALSLRVKVFAVRGTEG